MQNRVKYALALTLLGLFGRTAKADILFFDDLTNQINVYYTTHTTINFATDLIYTTTGETVQTQPVQVYGLPTLPNNVNIYDGSHTLSDVLQFFTTGAGGGYYNVTVGFTSGYPATPAPNAISLNEDGLIHDIGTASGWISGYRYSVDVQVRTAVEHAAVPEPSPWALLFGVPVLALLKRKLAV